MRETDQNLKAVVPQIPANVRAAIASLRAASDAMFEEQSADPRAVNEAWLDAQVVELRELYARADSLFPD